jgi:hypothetical protein
VRAGLAVVLSLALGGCGRAPVRHAERMTIWAETLPADRIADRVAFAAANHLNLNVAAIQGQTDPAYLQTLCTATDGADVALKLWPLLPMSQGYWANQSNVDAYDAWIDQLLSWAAGTCPRLDGVVVDMEQPIDRTMQLVAMRADGQSNVQIAEWLLGGIDEAAFERARGLFDAEGQKVRGQGYSYSVSTLPMVADGYDAGTETLAQALWTPIDGIQWDAVSFQVYRSLFQSEFPAANGQPYDAGLVTSYAQTIVGKWGALGAVDLGTTGAGVGVTMGLPGAADLQADLGAALAAGIAPGHLAVYSLEGLDGKPDAAAWVALPAPMAVPASPTDDQPRATFRTLALLGGS